MAPTPPTWSQHNSETSISLVQSVHGSLSTRQSPGDVTNGSSPRSNHDCIVNDKDDDMSADHAIEHRDYWQETRP